MKQISVYVRPGGGFPPGLYVGDELAKPAAGLPAGTIINHSNAMLLYGDSSIDQIKVIENPDRQEFKPIFPLNLYKTARRYRKGTILYRKDQAADALYYDLTEGRYFPTEALMDAKYPDTYSLPLNATLLSIPLEGLFSREGDVKGLAAEAPQIGIDIIEDIAVKLYYQVEAFIRNQQITCQWMEAKKSLIWAVSGLIQSALEPYPDEEHPLCRALGFEDFGRLKSYIYVLREKFIRNIKIEKLSHIFATYEEYGEILGPESSNILFDDPAAIWKDHLSAPEIKDSADAEDLFAKADEASRAIKDLLEPLESGYCESEAPRRARKLEVDKFLRSSGKEQTVLLYASGDIVYFENDLGTEVYLVLEGRLDYSIEGRKLGTLGRNNFFGHLSHFVAKRRKEDDPPVRLYTVNAATHCKLLAMTKTGFIATLRKQPSYFRNIIAQSAKDQTRFSPDRSILDPRSSRVNIDFRDATYLDGIFRETVKYYYLAFEKMQDIDEGFQKKMAGFLGVFERDYLLDRFIPTMKELHRFSEEVYSRRNRDG